ncbi:sensory box histidine kinase PhoR [soil metagenome]
MSIRARIVVATLALTLAGLSSAGFFTYRLIESFLVQRLDEQIARQSGRLIVQGSPQNEFIPPPTDALVPVSDGAYFEMRNSEGEVIDQRTVEGSDSVPIISDDLLSQEGTFTAQGSNGGSDFRVSVTLDPLNGNSIISALPMTDIDATLSRLVWVELGVSAIVLVIMGGLVFAVVRVGLRPLDEVVDAADAIAGGDLSRRVPDANPRSEVGRLSAAFNAMIGAIESSFGRQRAAEQRLRAFVADASHELRTPLTPMRGYAEMLEGTALSDVDRRFAAARISESSIRMTRLVDDLLLLARMDEAPTLILANIDLSELALDAVADARAADPDRTIELIADGSVWVEGDRDHLARVIANLLTNVRMHTAQDVLATVEVKTEHDQAIIEVRDTGPGIPAERHAQLFDRFYRADTSRSRAKGGSGLGLSIVASIIEAHQGKLSVLSDGSNGTTFRILLPLAIVEESTALKYRADAKILSGLS